MIIVRKNKELKNPIIEKAFNVYLRLPDGSEHEIPGVVTVKQDVKLPSGPGHINTIDFSVYDDFVRFE